MKSLDAPLFRAPWVHCLPRGFLPDHDPNDDPLRGWCPGCSPYLIALAVMLRTFMEVLGHGHREQSIGCCRTSTCSTRSARLSSRLGPGQGHLDPGAGTTSRGKPQRSHRGHHQRNVHFQFQCRRSLCTGAVAAAQQDYEAKLANIRQAEANNIKAQTEVRRYEPLVQREEISQQQFDTVVAAAKSQKAMVEAAQASALASQEGIEQACAQLRQAQSRLTEPSATLPAQRRFARRKLLRAKARSSRQKHRPNRPS